MGKGKGKTKGTYQRKNRKKRKIKERKIVIGKERKMLYLP